MWACVYPISHQIWNVQSLTTCQAVTHRAHTDRAQRGTQLSVVHSFWGTPINAARKRCPPAPRYLGRGVGARPAEKLCPWWRAGLPTLCPAEKLCPWWRAGLAAPRPAEKLCPWWKAGLWRNVPSPAPCWKTVPLMKSRPPSPAPCWETVPLIKSRPRSPAPCWKTVPLMKSRPPSPAPCWKTVLLMKSRPPSPAPCWETVPLMKSRPRSPAHCISHGLRAARDCKVRLRHQDYRHGVLSQEDNVHLRPLRGAKRTPNRRGQGEDKGEMIFTWFFWFNQELLDLSHPKHVRGPGTIWLYCFCRHFNAADNRSELSALVFRLFPTSCYLG